MALKFRPDQRARFLSAIGTAAFLRDTQYWFHGWAEFDGVTVTEIGLNGHEIFSFVEVWR